MLRVGIVGLGTLAKGVHVPVLASMNNVDIIAVAEINANQGRAFCQKTGIPEFYEQYRHMYQDSALDAVFISLPNALHYDAVKAALQQGLHVYCAKPMGLRSQDAQDLVLLAQRKKLVLAVGYNRRSTRFAEQIVNATQSLTLGKLLQLHAILIYPGPYIGYTPGGTWHLEDKYIVLYDVGSHLIDLILYALSDRITEVSATSQNTMLGYDVDDNIVGHLKTQKGTIGTFHIGWRAALNYFAMEIHGTAGSVFADPFEVDVRYGSYGSLDKMTRNIKVVNRIIRKQIRLLRAKNTIDTSHLQQFHAFITAIQEQSQPLVSGVDGLRVLEVMEAVKASLEAGGHPHVVEHFEC
jgi:predicted dehydrogenase